MKRARTGLSSGAKVSRSHSWITSRVVCARKIGIQAIGEFAPVSLGLHKDREPVEQEPAVQ
jgi:hypothetical protein